MQNLVIDQSVKEGNDTFLCHFRVGQAYYSIEHAAKYMLFMYQAKHIVRHVECLAEA